ncbi:lipoate--protein ligase family protein [Halococcoides cellulosivorans]|uniref:Lipoate--protein ligase family protein n=1 Tax=Halococcoides cellulosivorans TaxID=1679096 RepID=A0A2R4WXL3_9EURY|nr:biotin/lipoate A/B protein ligase family protein [Halococcoides cellulosivorans]AWB26283.1 lipoate--protein ligase family protein [Halococcoides cellulosivorans]
MAEWTIVDSGTYDEATQQALERVLLDRVADGAIGPTLRIWYRDRPAVALGRYQAYADEVAADYVASEGISVVRRITGGGAMFVQPERVITYSLYLPADRVTDDIRQSYSDLDRWAIETLQELGLDAFHEPLNDIAHEEGKIGGSAQRRTDDAILHHTTMSYALDIEAMLRVLRVGAETVSETAIESADRRVARITDHTEVSRSAVIDALIDGIRERHGATERKLTDDELKRAQALVDEQFGTDAWTRQL